MGNRVKLSSLGSVTSCCIFGSGNVNNDFVYTLVVSCKTCLVWSAGYWVRGLYTLKLVTDVHMSNN